MARLSGFLPLRIHSNSSRSFFPDVGRGAIISAGPSMNSLTRWAADVIAGQRSLVPLFLFRVPENAPGIAGFSCRRRIPEFFVDVIRLRFARGLEVSNVCAIGTKAYFHRGSSNGRR